MEYEIELRIPSYQGLFFIQYEDEKGKDWFGALDNVTYDGLTLDTAYLPKNVSSPINKAVQADIKHRADFITAIKSVPKSAGLFHAGVTRLLDGRRITSEKIRKTVYDMKKQINEAPTTMLETIGQVAYKYFDGYKLNQ